MKRLIRGTSHTPAIAKGTYAVGTATSFDLHYNTAAAMWQHGHQSHGKKASLDAMTEFISHFEAWAKNFPPPRRREAIEHTKRKLGL